MAYFSHHQGMSMVALANVILDDVFVNRFHMDPRVQATELLLQERVPREAIISEPRPAEGVTLTPAVPTLASRGFRSPHTASPHTHFLSNGRYTTAVTHAGGGYSTWRGLSVTRHREDRTCDAAAHAIYLRDPWSGEVWSPTYLPLRADPDEYEVTFDLDKATFRHRDGEFETRLEIAISPEDDVEVRRLTIANHGDLAREIEVTSYAEIVLGRAEDDAAHPAFGKLFIETEHDPQNAGLLFSRRPRASDEAAGLGVPRSRRRQPCRRCGGMGNRSSPVPGSRAFDGRPRRTGRPSAVGHHRGCAGPRGRPARPGSSSAGSVRERDVRHRYCGQPGRGQEPGGQVPRWERRSTRVLDGIHARERHAPALGSHRGSGHAVLTGRIACLRRRTRPASARTI